MSALDVQPVLRRLLEEAVTAFDARGGAVFLDNAALTDPIYLVGKWTGVPKLTMLVDDPKSGAHFGQIAWANDVINAITTAMTATPCSK